VSDPARIAFATCHEYADLDPDDRLLIAPLAALGIQVEPAVWNAADVDWTRFDAVVLRSTWDYPDAYAAFLRWAGTIPRLINSLPVIRWNTDKRYLADLEAAGVPIVPTRFLEPGEAWHLPADWPEVVVKPVTSVGSRDTARYTRADPRIRGHVGRLAAAGRPAMLQPYLRAVDDLGETGLIYAAGTFSHAFRKGPLLRSDGSITSGLFAEEEIAARDPSPAERSVGDRVVAELTRRFGALVYARVDLLPAADGPRVIEVELTEPSLYLAYGHGSPERFGRAIADAVVGR
jgi:glutathione synthase/RimK-type ligase-like ATP-grasp enzyme